MKTLHIITGLSIGGAERALFSLLIGGLAEAHQTVVLSLQCPGAYGQLLQQRGVPVYTLGMRRALPQPYALWQLLKTVRDFDPDIIQGWMYHGNLAASVAARMMPRPRRPIVVWNVRHSLYSIDAERALTRQVIRANSWASKGADRILYNSRLSRSQHQAFGFAAGCADVIPNGFDTERIRPDAKRGSVMRDSLGVSRDAKVIGHVARFHPMKDHFSFLQSVVEVMHHRSDVICLLVGKGVNLANPALAGIVPPDFEGRFRFLGEREDVPDIMQAMDIFCSSSWSEAFPNVLGEAMACGIPCVTTNVGDSAYIVASTGTVVPPANSKSLALGLIKMVDMSDEERQALGRAARRRVKTLFSLPAVADQYIQLYQKLAAGG